MGMKALHWSIISPIESQKDKLGVTELLLAHPRINPDIKDDDCGTPLVHAITTNNISAVTALLAWTQEQQEVERIGILLSEKQTEDSKTGNYQSGALWKYI